MSRKIGRNDPCPCGSGKKVKKCCGVDAAGAQAPIEGMSFAVPGTKPSPEEVAKMTADYQRGIRESELWSLMVEEYGEEQAEKMLSGFQVKVQ